MAQNAAFKRTSSARKSDKAQSAEKALMGVPERIMAPRLIFIAVVAALVCFGFVMIYSASSVKAISESGDAAFYLKRQMIFAAIGLVMALVIALVDYHVWCNLMPVLWMASLALLVVVWLFGEDTNGASRWIEIGVIRLQPSEFAKISILLAAANIANEYYGERKLSLFEMLIKVAIFVVIPLGLILVQPDKGTTGVIVVMIMAVAFSAGVPASFIVKFIGFLGTIALVMGLRDDYSRQRILTTFDPWADAYDTGWQLTQGFIAFGSGGLFGVGLGMSREKYSYLPEAHNDFIFAIIGEEFGLVGTLLVLFAFALLAYEAIKIMRQAPDLKGKLIVVGCTALIITQAFLNIMSVLGMFPLSGKPLPFLSYGGSSIMSSLLLVGLVVNVSIRSTLPETVHDVRRRSLALASEEDTGVGVARPHSASRRSGVATVSSASTPSRQRGAAAASGGSVSLGNAHRGGLSVVEGGKSDKSGSERVKRTRGANGYERIDIHEDASTRLRGSKSSSKLTSTGGSSRSGATRTRRNKRS